MKHYDSRLRVWFVGDIRFEVSCDFAADIVSLLRLVTSRSPERLTDGIRITSKQNVKLDAAERAMYNIGRDAVQASQYRVTMLNKLLGTED